MEVYVKVECQHLGTGERTTTTTAILTMVAVNEEGRPIPVLELSQKPRKKNNYMKMHNKEKAQILKNSRFFNGKQWITHHHHLHVIPSTDLTNKKVTLK